jgi:Fur family iron response transcriptional regulator
MAGFDRKYWILVASCGFSSIRLYLVDWNALRHHGSAWLQRGNINTVVQTEMPEKLPLEPETRPTATIPDMLRQAGLRPTRQRLTLGRLLFETGDRHVTAEQLHAEVAALGEHVSLATVYNTLHQFKRAGLVRELAIEGSKAYFDTNTSNHNHFLLESNGELMDIPGDAIRVEGLPTPPDGMKITHVDVVVRLSKN